MKLWNSLPPNNKTSLIYTCFSILLRTLTLPSFVPTTTFVHAVNVILSLLIAMYVKLVYC